MRLLFHALIMKSHKTCHRAVFPKIMPYTCSCVLICCHYLYMIVLHSTLSLNMRNSDILMFYKNHNKIHVLGKSKNFFAEVHWVMFRFR